MKQRKLLRLMAVLGVLALLAAACGGSKEDGGDTGATGGDNGGDKKLATAPGFDGTTINVGVISPLSGPVPSSATR